MQQWEFAEVLHRYTYFPLFVSATLYDAIKNYAARLGNLVFKVKNLADKEGIFRCRGLNLDFGYS